jgi:CDP-glycerol glycerophosphotransferase
MPALSVVVVVHREQAHVEQCVRSVLAAPADVELIAVDDASPDHAGEILDELAATDPRLKVLHLDRRTGPRAGLEAATGDHVWFVDVADVLTPGAVPAVIEGARGADLLLVGYERESALGARTPGPKRATAGPGPLRPGMARGGAELFDKVMRRTLATTEPWQALLGAQRIAVDAEVRYLRRRAPSIDARRHAEQPDFFARYDADHELVREELLRQGLKELDRRTGDDRKAFFAELTRRVGRRPELARGSLRAYDALQTARQRKRALATRRTKLAAAARKRDLDRGYAAARKQPIDPELAVFASYWYRGVSDNPRAIHEKARELMPDLRCVWVVEADGHVPDGVEHVLPGTAEYFDVLARARFFVNNVNFPNHLVKRPGTVHVMTHHGTPLKRMGLDLRDTQIAGKRMDFAALLRRCARWDFSVSSNRLSTLVWERVYPVPCETLEVGYPRNDRLATATLATVAAARAELGIADGETAVLYAPTHREYRQGYEPTMDLAAVADGLGEGHVLLARLHYFYGADPVLRRLHDEGRVRDVGAHPSIETLCLAADVLVTDYSSLMFDYAVLDRPIVIHAPDWEVYRAMRGTYFDLMAEPPGAFTRTESEVVAAVHAGDPAPDERAAFRARFCAWDDGRASERVVRRAFLGESA